MTRLSIKKFLYEVCEMDEDDEYTLHHEFSRSLTEIDTRCIAFIMGYLLQRRNPFDVDKPIGLINISTGTKINKDSTDFLLNCFA